jgi:hypothetical protein
MDDDTGLREAQQQNGRCIKDQQAAVAAEGRIALWLMLMACGCPASQRSATRIFNSPNGGRVSFSRLVYRD